MKNEKISIGQNLKRIRKDLDLRQYQIAGNEVTRNLISLIENDKTPIYHNVANIISKNINKILYERGQDIYIQPEDILKPDRYNSRKIADTYIKRLEKRLSKKNYEIKLEELNEIENFLNKWNFIDKKVKIYDLLGDIYYNAKDPNKEYYYYLKALEVSYEYPNIRNRFKIVLKLVYNCIITKKYSEAIRLCDFALSTQEAISEKYKGIFYYNSALAYYYLENYSKALDQIIYAKFYVAYNNYREMKRILMLEGICNFEIKNYDGALRTYNKLLKITNDNAEDICLTYINIVQIYIDKNDKQKVNEYHNKILKYLPYIDESSYYLFEILFSLSNVYYYLNDYESCENSLKEALALAKNHNNTVFFTKNFLKILDLYIETNQLKKTDSLITEYENQIYNFEINEDFKVILKIIYSFIKLGNQSQANHLIKNILIKEGSKDED
ncbi:hypothetical protein K8M07_08660 [Schnuerera sp. xch1]|uniref:hypothetical protein n=1 Tax=Schnuerera sp. xch1 TaxID=2874283 RepID=UPI001CBD5C39|nr:hypothetical protein [Schnuerera sp. xch1]MBZ2175318.1 hypothetical protein [Schnuerera sp. xch1]